jgi:NADH ubiquinone oxidoreductase, 20 Kd subunit
MSKLKIATIWLDGCSGCHMSFLDMDERLIGILEVADLVYSPLVDAKEFPDDVDITLVEGAVSTTDDLKKLRKAPRALQASGRAGRLRRDRQCAVDAQHVWTDCRAGYGLHRERDDSEANSARSDSEAAEVLEADTRTGKGRCLLARLSAVG